MKKEIKKWKKEDMKMWKRVLPQNHIFKIHPHLIQPIQKIQHHRFLNLPTVHLLPLVHRLFMKLLHSINHTSHQFRRNSMVDHFKESNRTCSRTKLIYEGGARVVDDGEVDCGDFLEWEIIIDVTWICS